MIIDHHRPGIGPADDAARLGGDTAMLRLAAARVRACEFMPYLSAALFALGPRPSDAVRTAAVDQRWRLYWNPGWVATLTVDQLAGVLLHEVSHLLREHAERFEAIGDPPERGPLFNLAGDAAINTDLAAAGVPLPAGSIHVKDISGAAPGMTTEQLYRLLVTADDGRPAHRVPPKPGSAECGSGADSVPRPWEGPTPNVTVPGGTGDGGIDGIRGWMIRQQVATDVREASGRGEVPAGLTQWAERIDRPVIDWRRQLARMMRRQLAPTVGRADYSYLRPSRRGPAVPSVVLPAMVATRPPAVSVVIDTSGSMSPARLGRCIAELEGILRSVARTTGAVVRVAVCDATARPARAVRSVAAIELVGGGGTDLRPAIRDTALARPRPDVVVVLTDGDTPWDPCPPPANAQARYLAVLVDGPRRVPGWVRSIPVDDRPPAGLSRAATVATARGRARP